MSLSDRNLLPKSLSKYQFIHLDINGAKKWIPKVGTSFTWFFLKKTLNAQATTIANNYIIHDVQKAQIDAGSKFIPLYYSNVVRTIFNKTVNN